MITTSDFKRGTRILIDGDPYVIMDIQTQTPSARGAATLVKIKVRNLKTDQVFDKSFKSGEKFNEPDLEKKSIQFLFDDGDSLTFMDTTSYDQFTLQKQDIGEKANYITDGLELKALFFEGKVLDLDLPLTVEFEVIEVEPGTRGDTVQGSATKPASLSNGLRVQVPLYIEAGNVIRISTKDGKFAERAK
ncbi:MAG: elongation factor P [Deltaproteobacteria bacterium]|nr:elongation factor P [Deltaproteobacteria bacterium]MBW1872059.1 elongation factor P [Deltaproteobacteria bacterium]